MQKSGSLCCYIYTKATFVRLLCCVTFTQQASVQNIIIGLYFGDYSLRRLPSCNLYSFCVIFCVSFTQKIVRYIYTKAVAKITTLCIYFYAQAMKITSYMPIEIHYWPEQKITEFFRNFRRQTGYGPQGTL